MSHQCVSAFLVSLALNENELHAPLHKHLCEHLIRRSFGFYSYQEVLCEDRKHSCTSRTIAGASATGVQPHLFDPEMDLDEGEEPVRSAEFPNAERRVSLVLLSQLFTLIDLVLVMQYRCRLDRNVIRSLFLYLTGAIQFNLLYSSLANVA